MARRPLPPSLGLVLVRLVTGAVLAAHGWRSVRALEPSGRVLERTVEDALAGRGALLAWWGETLLLGNPDAIAFLWRWTALFTGILLVLGALTRPAGWIAALFLAHAWVYGPPEDRVTFLLLLVSAVASALSRAGRRFGLDRLLDEQLPTWLTWTARRDTFLG